MSLTKLAQLLGYTPRRLREILEVSFERRGGATVQYDPHSKRLHTTVPSSRLYGAKTASEAIAILQAAHLWDDGAATPLLCPVTDTRAFCRGPAPDTFRTLLGACTRRQVVDVVYQARTRQHAVSFSPHTLVISAYRPHFRGYSTFELQGESRFWDLVPSRVLSAEVRPALGYVGAAADAEWQAETMLHLKLKQELPGAMQQAIRYEQRIDGDELTIGPIRKALQRYVLAEYLDRRFEGFQGPAWDVVQA